MELSSGFLLKDRYLIKELLGKGGMGAVYLAEDQALDQLVAVKSNLNPGEQSQRQFEVEARLLAKLRHPNLPLVFDHFIIDEVQYLVMDYIPGENLSQWLKDEGAQAVYKVLEWAEQISGALSYLHSQDPPVIHRDIKPANLKITPAGQIVLVDFGIAKASSEHTTVGAQGYTPGYAPPEQYGEAVTGPYSDQYSFAATLYALLTGSPPPESVDIMLGEKALTSARVYATNIPVHVDFAIRKAMSPEPDMRFANVGEFFTALTDPAALADVTLRPGTDTIEALSESPTIAKPATTPPQPAAPKKKGRPLLWIGLLVAGAVVIGGGALVAALLGGSGLFASAPTATQSLPQVIPTNTPPKVDEPEPEIVETATEAPTPTTILEPTATFTPSPEPTPFGGGGKIIFISNRDGYDQIYEMNADGSNLVQLTFDETHKSWPAYSPDGTKILYVGDGGFGPYNTKLGPDVWVMDADGSNQTNLTQTKGVDDDPVWSPDGSKIVFVSYRFGGSRQLTVMNSDGSEQKRVSFEFEEYNPTFSPNGGTLLFSSTFFFTLNMRQYRDGEMPANVDSLFDLKLEPELYDDRYDEPDRIGKGDSPAWSPDGNWIIYIRTNGNNRRIYLLDANSNGATVRHLEVPGLNYDPAWSPDSQHIVFANSTSGNLEIYTMDLGGRFQTNLTNFEGDDKMPNWKPVP
jgi:serine/threonine-protein kinase